MNHNLSVAHPMIIQGGMGISVSNWLLARAVSQAGQLGVVSGAGLDLVLARRLQKGDPGGHIRLALDNFPFRDIAERVWNRYFIPGGKAEDAPFKSKPVPSLRMSRDAVELLVLGNFVEVFLAKWGHGGIVGINYLEKIQLPTLPSLFGAMLAGVDYVLMGAGIPRSIPGALDHLARFEPAEIPIAVTGATADQHFTSRFDPAEFCGSAVKPLCRPKFLAIVSSHTLAANLAKKASGRVDGFVIEGPTAGGHNAPPRGALSLDETGEPIYGDRDAPDLQGFRDLGLPFWLAGSWGTSDGLRKARGLGAEGVQVGTAFAFCRESGIDDQIKSRVLRMVIEGHASVFTDPFASPTGFPFKVLKVAGTLSDPAVVESRKRVCDLGYLRELYLKEDGSVGYRCAAEPAEDYVTKGGHVEDTIGRLCVCNGLLSTAGLDQVRKGHHEPPLVTCGNDVVNIGRFLKQGETTYGATDVIDSLLQGQAEPILTQSLL